MSKNSPLSLFFFAGSFFAFMNSKQWFFMWLMMEMNTLTFMSLYFFQKMKSENLILYFLVQSLASFLLIYTSTNSSLMSLFMSGSNLLWLSILLKIGIAPFHTWVAPLIVMSEKFILYVFLILQKIIPFLWLLLSKNMWFLGLMVSSIFNILVISMMNILNSNMKLIMGFSSMSHGGWLIISSASPFLWEMYFFVYSVILSAAILMLLQNNLKVLLQKNNKISMLIMMMLLGGIPPFMGFFPKFLILKELMEMKSSLMLSSLLIISLMDLFIYSRIGVKSTLTNKENNKWQKKETLKLNILWLNLILLLGISL